MPTEDGSWKAWTLLTAMEELKGHEEHLGARRRKGVAHGEQHGRRNWLEQRARENAFDDADPQVLVVGGGQAGLTVAARLKQLDIPMLIALNMSDLARQRGIRIDKDVLAREIGVPVVETVGVRAAGVVELLAGLEKGWLRQPIAARAPAAPRPSAAAPISPPSTRTATA